MNKKIIVGAVTAVVVAAVGVGIWQFSGNKTPNAGNNLVTETTENTTISVEVPTENVSAGVYEIKNTPDTSPVDDALYANIAALNNAVRDYYNANSKSLLCMYGLMYSDADNFTVSASKVLEQAGTQPIASIDDYADVLLIRPADLAGFQNAELRRPEDKALKPFTAYNSSQGYIVSSYEDKGAVLTRDEYRQLLGTYATDHGQAQNPAPSTDDYLDISACAAVGEGGYNIKYIACDEKYAVMVSGSVKDSKKIRQYVLTKKTGGWCIVMDGLENSLTPRYDVNQTYPDMELGLLPKYVIAEHGEIKSGFPEFEQSLIKLGMITNEDMPETYSCGAGRFAYIELNSGKKLLGYVNDQNKLEFYPVNNTNEAIAYMLKFQENPPVFILNYENEG